MNIGASPSLSNCVLKLFLCRGGRQAFKESVEVNEEFAHDGGKSDFVRFARSTKPLVDGLEDRVAARGGECRHVQGDAHL